MRCSNLARRVSASYTRTVPLLIFFALGRSHSLGWSGLTLFAQVAVRNQGYVPYSDAPIFYPSNDLDDPVTKLQKRLEAHRTTLEYDGQTGYLKSILKHLNIPVSSQTLVFSKTSFQYKKITQQTPRALYFNDDVYIGYVHDGKAIDVVSFDPRQGAIFYLMDVLKVDSPTFQRAELDCTQCYIAKGTRDVPGVLLGSIFPTQTSSWGGFGRLPALLGRGGKKLFESCLSGEAHLAGSRGS
jgi:hypothetical protein